jgi:hypothetical protein
MMNQMMILFNLKYSEFQTRHLYEDQRFNSCSCFPPFVTPLSEPVLPKQSLLIYTSSPLVTRLSFPACTPHLSLPTCHSPLVFVNPTIPTPQPQPVNPNLNLASAPYHPQPDLPSMKPIIPNAPCGPTQLVYPWLRICLAIFR